MKIIISNYLYTLDFDKRYVHLRMLRLYTEYYSNVYVYIDTYEE